MYAKVMKELRIKEQEVRKLQLRAFFLAFNL